MRKQKKAVKAPVMSLARLLETTTSRSTWRNTVARVRYIHEQVRSGKMPTCAGIAKHFEVSTRTIDRDIEAMRNSLDLPLAFCFQRNGYYYTREVPSDLPRPRLTAGDVLAFCLARRALERFRGTDFAEIFDRALRKIMDEVEGDIVFEWEELDELVSFGPAGLTQAPEQAIAAVVCEGLMQRRELELDYRNLDAKEYERRTIRPLHLRAMGDTLFLFALDPWRPDGKVRSFVLSRMRNVRVTKREFARPEGFDPDEVRRHCVGAYGGTNAVRVRLRLSDKAARFLDERPLHPTQKIVRKKSKAKDGAAVNWELTMQVALTPELEQKILFWGLDVEVLEPPALRERIVETAKAIVARAEERAGKGSG